MSVNVWQNTNCVNSESEQITSFATFADYTAAGTTLNQECPDSLRAKDAWDGKTVYVIFGIDMNAPEFKNGDFLWMGDLVNYGMAESDLDGLSLPLTGAVVTFRKGTVVMLNPNAEEFILDGEPVSRARFDSLTGDSIQRVTLDGRRILIETKFIPESENNIDVLKATDDESRMMRRIYGPEMRKKAE